MSGGSGGSLTSSAPAHRRPTAPSPDVTDVWWPLVRLIDGVDFSLRTDIMTCDGEVVDVLLSETNTHAPRAKSGEVDVSDSALIGGRMQEGGRGSIASKESKQGLPLMTKTNKQIEKCF